MLALTVSVVEQTMVLPTPASRKGDSCLGVHGPSMAGAMCCLQAQCEQPEAQGLPHRLTVVVVAVMVM